MGKAKNTIKAMNNTKKYGNRYWWWRFWLAVDLIFWMLRGSFRIDLLLPGGWLLEDALCSVDGKEEMSLLWSASSPPITVFALEIDVISPSDWMKVWNSFAIDRCRDHVIDHCMIVQWGAVCIEMSTSDFDFITLSCRGWMLMNSSFVADWLLLLARTTC